MNSGHVVSHTETLTRELLQLFQLRARFGNTAGARVGTAQIPFTAGRGLRARLKCSSAPSMSPGSRRVRPQGECA